MKAKAETLTEAWSSYNSKVLPNDAPQIQRSECRRAFYAGAAVVLNAMFVIGEDDVTDEVGIEIIEGLHKEARTFIESLKKQPAGGGR